MGYRVELRITDEIGNEARCPTDGRRHKTLVHAWSAGMQAARVEAVRHGANVQVRILDDLDAVTVTGSVDAPLSA